MLSLFIAATGVLSTLIVQVLMLRAKSSHGKAYVVSKFFGLALVIIVSLCYSEGFHGKYISFLFVTVLFFLTWWFVLLNVLQSFVSSLRINILRLLMENGGKISKKRFHVIYNDRKLIETRIIRLKTAGAISETNGFLYVSSFKLRLLAKCFGILKILIVKRSSEFHV